MPEIERIIIFQESDGSWLAALCRTGFETHQEATEWLTTFLRHKEVDGEKLAPLFEEAIADALRQNPIDEKY